ncbi:hypothetical protein E8E14_007023 [Neopestalotiopsis sp. 37M]|nr:hypothetical protein E8E14_007023 [Neopestalotiopsis sp. 37M]
METLPYAGPEDWAKHKTLIMSLYETKSLNEVIRFMRDEHHFRATSKMYKYQFAKWGVRKNLSVKFFEELDQLENDTSTSSGKPRRVYLRGHEVNKKDLNAFVIRRAARNQWNQVLSATDATRAPGRAIAPLRKASTPATPPGPLRLPDGLYDFEKIFHSLKTYAEGSFPDWQWRADAADSPCSRLDSWTIQMTSISDMLRCGHARQAFQMLEVCHQQCRDLVMTQDPRLIIRIFRAILPFLQDHPAIVKILLKYLGGLSTIIHGEMHPLRQVAQSWYIMDQGEIVQRARPLLQSYYALLQKEVESSKSRQAMMGYAGREIHNIMMAHNEPINQSRDSSEAAVVSWLGGDYYHTMDAATQALESEADSDIEFTRFHHQLVSRFSYDEQDTPLELAQSLTEYSRITFPPGDCRTVTCLAITSTSLRKAGYTDAAIAMEKELEDEMDLFCTLAGSPSYPQKKQGTLFSRIT